MKRKLIGGNWKCNGTVKQAKGDNIILIITITIIIIIFQEILKLLNGSGSWPLEAEVVIAVPSIHLNMVKDNARSGIIYITFVIITIVIVIH